MEQTALATKKPAQGFTSVTKIRSKIPPHLHDEIFHWLCAGIPASTMLKRLEADRGFHTNMRTLQRLLKFMAIEKLNATKAAIANQVHTEVITDLHMLNSIRDTLASLAHTARAAENYRVFFQSVQGLTRILELKFRNTHHAIEAPNAQGDPADWELLEGLLAKFAIQQAAQDSEGLPPAVSFTPGPAPEPVPNGAIPALPPVLTRVAPDTEPPLPLCFQADTRYR